MTNEKPFSAISIQIATPCMDAKYTREYTKSFHNAASLLIHFGAKVDWAELPFVSDIGLARSKIFGNFLRSSHTHLMLVDADMGFNPSDICRLLVLNREYVGGAGPKKIYPIAFAANNCDENGALLRTEIEAVTGLVEVTEVGAAFMLMSKSCAQKMADAYPDLAYVGDDEKTEYALYDSFLVGSLERRRRLSEDFAFCHRWRKIGGKIYLLPDIHLTHTGTHVWEGALIEALQGKPLDQTA